MSELGNITSDLINAVKNLERRVLNLEDQISRLQVPPTHAAECRACNGLGSRVGMNPLGRWENLVCSGCNGRGRQHV